LLPDYIRPSVELLRIRFGPPPTQIPFSIELPAFVIEAMGNLVSDCAPHATIVDGIIGLRVEKRRLHDSSGERDFVRARVVVGVDRWRRHAPFFSVRRPSDLSQNASRLEFVGSKEIGCKRSGPGLEPGVVAPGIGIPNLIDDRLQLGIGLPLGFRAHPCELA
jgi:hypothetical protein